jgi:hypothetical protein
MSRHEQHISRQIRQGLKGTQVTFMTVDESSRIDAKPLDVACVKCGAAAGEHCSPRRRPVHSERWWDVQAAQAAFDVLTEQEV